MGFCEDHDVDIGGLHMVYDGVDLGGLRVISEIPLPYSDLLACGYLNVMGVLVCCVVWILDVGFEPVCSGSLCGVGVLSRWVCLGM